MPAFGQCAASFKTRRRRASVAAGPGGYGYQMGRNTVLSQLRVTVVAGHSGAVGRSGSRKSEGSLDLCVRHHHGG